jgi:hypothetical protein
MKGSCYKNVDTCGVRRFWDFVNIEDRKSSLLLEHEGGVIDSRYCIVSCRMVSIGIVLGYCRGLLWLVV